MKIYKHTQPGYTTFFTFTVVAILIVSSNNLSFENTYVPIAMLSIISVLFCSLTIEVKKEAITWHFGPYFWRKKIDPSEIARVEIVTNPWWFGWGIRWTKFGWLYNVSGLQAVQVTKKDGKAIRLGTDDPVGLSKAINEATKHP